MVIPRRELVVEILCVFVAVAFLVLFWRQMDGVRLQPGAQSFRVWAYVAILAGFFLFHSVKAAKLLFRGYGFACAGVGWRGDLVAEEGRVYEIGPLEGLAGRTLDITIKAIAKLPQMASFRIDTPPKLHLRYQATVLGEHGAPLGELASRTWSQTIETTENRDTRWTGQELTIPASAERCSLRLAVLDFRLEAPRRAQPDAKVTACRLHISLKPGLRLGDRGHGLSLRDTVATQTSPAISPGAPRGGSV